MNSTETHSGEENTYRHIYCDEDLIDVKSAQQYVLSRKMELENRLNSIEEQKMSTLRELSHYTDNLNDLYTHHLNILKQVNEILKNENSLLRESSSTNV